MNPSILYIFLDEGGNFDFSANGTQFFTLTCVTLQRPFKIDPMLYNYHYDCIEWGLNHEYFHCSQDNKHVRNKVFSYIQKEVAGIQIDTLIADKSKISPKNQQDLYAKMVGVILQTIILRENKQHIDEFIIVTDKIPLNKKRKAAEKAIKETLANLLPNDCRYKILHHSSKSHFSLQIADYCNWAIYKKWENGIIDYYKIIEPAIITETIYPQAKET